VWPIGFDVRRSVLSTHRGDVDIRLVDFCCPSGLACRPSDVSIVSYDISNAREGVKYLHRASVLQAADCVCYQISLSLYTKLLDNQHFKNSLSKFSSPALNLY
jgi:hypothetical protein